MVFAVVTPTRRPVNSPGPSPTAMPDSRASSTSSSRQRYSIAGASCSAWRRSRPRRTSPRTAPSSPTATLTCGVAVSRQRSGTSGPDGQLGGSGAPRSPATFDLDDALVVAGAGGQTNLEAVGRQHAVDGVAPFDQRHGVLAHDLLEAEVVQLLERADPVHVDVHDRDPALVLAHDRERRAHHGIGDAERARHPSSEHGLPRSEVSREGNDVAGAEQLADGLRDGEGLVRGTRHDPTSPRHALGDDARSAVTRCSARLTRTKSARACASAVPPLRSTAEGWNVGISTPRPRNGNSRPRNFVIPSFVSSRSLVAKLPSVTTTAGSMNPS